MSSGTRLGKYRLSKRLGIGGSCEVWKARDSVEGIWVALKIPLREIDGSRDNKSALKEIRSVSRLRHPNILSIKNADIIDGHAVLATELSTGTLSDRAKPMSVKNILSIMYQVLHGLAYAHRNRIVHCDVSPNNIFLFRNNRAALGDFGISLEVKGRQQTIDDFGTPGYVAPEQAYGRPTYTSDCFAAGLIMYEYITGSLPKWPFDWPFRGHKMLCEKTSVRFADFLKKSLTLTPDLRFANASVMLDAMVHAMPATVKRELKKTKKAPPDWKRQRREAFQRKYNRYFPVLVKCRDCGELIAESMHICPWCGSDRNRFDKITPFSHYCHRCRRGIMPQWHYCPWCYGPGFEPQLPEANTLLKYNCNCSSCGKKQMYFMKYCPWCRSKNHPWKIRTFPEKCGSCSWPVDSEFWTYCPWCDQGLT